ncbi:MAG: chorismate-binding protein [Piscirickettsiaceae bacterium]|nr:chorismate-binding protein [Piscirickettsiaceae bacterium]
MIVDLSRNYIGKVCLCSWIHIFYLNHLQYNHFTVHSLLSIIIGATRDNKNYISSLRSCFSGVLIMSAPKLRAIEIIEKLESYFRDLLCWCGLYWLSMVV